MPSSQPISRRYSLGALFSLAFASFGFAPRTAQASGYPSVGELEASLNLRPGGQLPKEVVAGGQLFDVYYVRGEQRGGGEYAVVVRLKAASRHDAR